MAHRPVLSVTEHVSVRGQLATQADWGWPGPTVVGLASTVGLGRQLAPNISVTIKGLISVYRAGPSRVASDPGPFILIGGYITKHNYWSRVI